MPNSPLSPRRSWPYVIAAVVVFAIQEGWSPSAVGRLAAILLVLIALVQSAGHGGGE